MTGSELPIAGWYPDPEDSSKRRWWDGGQWTAQIRPEPTAQPVQQAGPIETSSETEFPPLPEQQEAGSASDSATDADTEVIPPVRPDELSSPFVATPGAATEAAEQPEDEDAAEEEDLGHRFTPLRLILGLAAIIVIVVAVIVLTGGGSEPADGVLITQQQFGSTWPFSVSQGYVNCEGGGRSFGPVTFTAPDGTVYGVNGLALADGYPPIRPIWLKSDDPSSDTPRVPIGPVIDKGLTLCQ